MVSNNTTNGIFTQTERAARNSLANTAQPSDRNGIRQKAAEVVQLVSEYTSVQQTLATVEAEMNGEKPDSPNRQSYMAYITPLKNRAESLTNRMKTLTEEIKNIGQNTRKAFDNTREVTNVLRQDIALSEKPFAFEERLAAMEALNLPPSRIGFAVNA